MTFPIANPNVPQKKQGKLAVPILRKEIEEAQKHTVSNASAAKFLGVSYPKYKKYAKLYNLFDSHMNPTGIGTEKGFAKRPTSIPLKDILQNKHPNYSVAKLKNRLIARGKLQEQCMMCGFNEKRFTDKKAPLIIGFKDGNRKNMALDNLELLCYNCIFLTTGAPQVIYRTTVDRAIKGVPITNTRIIQPDVTVADSREREIEDEYDFPEEMILTDEEKEQLMNIDLKE